MKITLNTREIEFEASSISFEDIAALVDRKCPSVVWKIRGKNESGMLAPGESVTVREGMCITAIVTGNA